MPIQPSAFRQECHKHPHLRTQPWKTWWDSFAPPSSGQKKNPPRSNQPLAARFHHCPPFLWEAVIRAMSKAWSEEAILRDSDALWWLTFFLCHILDVMTFSLYCCNWTLTEHFWTLLRIDLACMHFVAYALWFDLSSFHDLLNESRVKYKPWVETENLNKQC